MPARRARLGVPSLCALGVLAALAGGCRRASAPAVDRRVAFGLREYRLVPRDARARAGEVTLAARNVGIQVHDLRVRRNDGPALASTRRLFPGERQTIVVRLRPGTYRLYCSLFRHQQLGMYGTLTVTR